MCVVNNLTVIDRFFSRSDHRDIWLRLLDLLFLLLLPVESVLNARQQHRVVFADVLLIADRDLVALVIKHGLQHTAGVQILLLSNGHRCEELLKLPYQFHS